MTDWHLQSLEILETLEILKKSWKYHEKLIISLISQ